MIGGPQPIDLPARGWESRGVARLDQGPAVTPSGDSGSANGAPFLQQPPGSSGRGAFVPRTQLDAVGQVTDCASVAMDGVLAGAHTLENRSRSQSCKRFHLPSEQVGRPDHGLDCASTRTRPALFFTRDDGASKFIRKIRLP
jgi:hypothetical protein